MHARTLKPHERPHACDSLPRKWLQGAPERGGWSRGVMRQDSRTDRYRDGHTDIWTGEACEEQVKRTTPIRGWRSMTLGIRPIAMKQLSCNWMRSRKGWNESRGKARRRRREGAELGAVMAWGRTAAAKCQCIRRHRRENAVASRAWRLTGN
jgi:hypothetical protein